MIAVRYLQVIEGEPMKKKTPKYGPFGQRVVETLRSRGLTLADLEEYLEEKLGCFLRIGYLDHKFRKRQMLPPRIYREIKRVLFTAPCEIRKERHDG